MLTGLGWPGRIKGPSSNAKPAYASSPDTAIQLGFGENPALDSLERQPAASIQANQLDNR